MDKIVLSKLSQYKYNNDMDEYIYPGRSWTYEVILDAPVGSDSEIVLTYYNVDIEYGIDFTGPEVVIVEAGSDRVKFNVHLFITDDIFEKYFKVTAWFDDESDEVRSYVISRVDCPWYRTPMPKRHCKPMVGLPPEYQEQYCDNKAERFIDQSPACKDIYFWDMISCKDAFINSPPMYVED